MIIKSRLVTFANVMLKVTLVISRTIGVLCATVMRLRKFICVRRKTEREEDETLPAFSIEVEIGG